MKNEKNQNSKYNIRHYIELFSIIMCMGLIAVNSLYLKGYICNKLTVNDGLIVNTVGYMQEENKFTYNANEKCLIQIPNFNNAKEILFDFNSIANDDVNVSLYSVDSDGKSTDVNQKIKWKKGSRYFKFKMTDDKINGYCLEIPTDFTLNCVYYAIPGGCNIPKYKFYILSVFIAIFMSSLLFISEKVRKSIECIENKLIVLYKNIIIGYKKIVKNGLIELISIIFSILITKILEKIGICSFNWKTTILVLSFGILMASVIFFRKYFVKNIEKAGFITILFVGTLITILEPPTPGISWDDGTHYNRAATLSHMFDRQQSLADLMGRENEEKVGATKLFYGKEEQKAYIELLNDVRDSNYYTSSGDLSALLSSTGVAYIPSAVGLVLTRGLGLPYHVQFIFGKWMNVLTLAILCYFAMKQLKSGKFLVLLIALIPTNIFIASNYTYDTWLTGWSILGLSTFFGEIQRPDEIIKKKSIWIIFISMLLAVLPKMVYFPLTFIVFFMPRSKFSSKKDYWKYKLLILFNIAIPFIFVLMKNVISVAGTTGQGDMRGGEDVDSGGQIAYILNNPIQTLKTMFNFLKVYLNPLIEGREYINNMAYNGYIPHYEVVLGVIIVSALVSRNEKEEGKYPWWFRSGVVLVYAGIGALAAIAMYIGFTAVGLDTVAGCQGRYIIPALFPTLFVLTRFSGRTYVKNFVKEENINCLAVSVLALFSLYGMWMGCVSLY